MKIKSTLINRAGESLDYFFEKIKDESELRERKVDAVHAFCFCDGKLVIVYDRDRKKWGPVGGGVEPGENVQEAVIREVKEEANMRVTKQQVIGFIDIDEKVKHVVQTRSYCKVEPYGPFVADPAGDVSEIKLIDPLEAKKYFDWGEIGDYILKRAVEIDDGI